MTYEVEVTTEVTIRRDGKAARTVTSRTDTLDPGWADDTIRDLIAAVAREATRAQAVEADPRTYIGPLL